MKKAVISIGGKQYVVSEDQTLLVDLLKPQKELTFEPLLVINDQTTQVGSPLVSGVKVAAQISEPEIKADKVVAIRFKAKKRVNKVRGHRQRHTQIKILKIAG